MGRTLYRIPQCRSSREPNFNTAALSFSPLRQAMQYDNFTADSAGRVGRAQKYSHPGIRDGIAALFVSGVHQYVRTYHHIVCFLVFIPARDTWQS
jgi:hypothetical protein